MDRLEKACAYLRQAELDNLPVGRYEIDGENIYMMIQEYETKKTSEGKMEAHDRYIDIQYIIKGREAVATADRARLDKIAVPYDEAKDIMFYEDPEEEALTWTVLNEGQKIILYPQDAHKPCCQAAQGVERVKKAVLKIKIEENEDETN